MNAEDQKNQSSSGGFTGEDRWDEILDQNWIDDFLQEDDPQASKKDSSVATAQGSSDIEPVPEVSPTKDNVATNVTQEIIGSDAQDWLEGSKADMPDQLDLDIYETENNLIVLCQIAGVDEKDIDVSIGADNVLNIRGKLSASIIDDVVNDHHVQECYWGEFSRSISLPVDVKKDNGTITATLEKGILKIVFIKIRQDAIRKIDVSSK